MQIIYLPFCGLAIMLNNPCRKFPHDTTSLQQHNLRSVSVVDAFFFQQIIFLPNRQQCVCVTIYHSDELFVQNVLLHHLDEVLTAVFLSSSLVSLIRLFLFLPLCMCRFLKEVIQCKFSGLCFYVGVLVEYIYIL